MCDIDHFKGQRHIRAPCRRRCAAQAGSNSDRETQEGVRFGRPDGRRGVSGHCPDQNRYGLHVHIQPAMQNRRKVKWNQSGALSITVSIGVTCADDKNTVDMRYWRRPTCTRPRTKAAIMRGSQRKVPRYRTRPCVILISKKRSFTPHRNQKFIRNRQGWR